MAFDYASVASDAAEVLEEFGASATITRTSGVYNPATGMTSEVTVTQALTAVMFPYADRMIDGTQIRAGDRQVFASAVDVVTIPQAGDKFTWGTETWGVVQAKHLSPARVYALLEMQVRR